MSRRRPATRRCRATIMLLALAGFLAGCAARQEQPAPGLPAPQAAPWTAAVGKLEVAGARPCTAVLVASDLILTAAHCLHQGPIASTAGDLRFLPNFGAEPVFPPSAGRALRAQGGAIRDGRLNSPEQVGADWGLVEISPPVTGAAPLPLLRLSTREVSGRIAAGERLFTAGYGYGAMKELRQHQHCGIVPQPEQSSPVFQDGILVTDCIIRIGDSGGPVVLLGVDGKPSLVGIFVGFGRGKDTGWSFAVNAGRVIPYLGGPLLSMLLPDETGGAASPTVVPGLMQVPAGRD